MTGSLTIKYDKYYVVLNYKDEAGKWRQKWVSTELTVKNNKRKAEQFLSDIIAEYTKTNTTPTKDILFIDFLFYWLDVNSSAVEVNTHQSYESHINRYIKPHFTKIKVTLQSDKSSCKHSQSTTTCFENEHDCV